MTFSFWPGAEDSGRFPEHPIACYRFASGERSWDTRLPRGPGLLSNLEGGSPAPTPAAGAEQSYVVFGWSIITALDCAGQPVWRRWITPHQFDLALGACLMSFGGAVLV